MEITRLKIKRLLNKPTCVTNLKCGQIAEIVETKTPGYLGRIVQRHGNRLIALGHEKGASWADISGWEPNLMIIRVLDKGEKIIISK